MPVRVVESTELKHDGPMGEKLLDLRFVLVEDVPILKSSELMMVSAEIIADMYKARWKIESFFRWIKQHLNVPVIFGTTPNAVYNQLFTVHIAYVLLKWLYKKTKSKGFLCTIFRRISSQTSAR